MPRAFGQKRGKYGNRRTVSSGITFDSAKESRRHGELLLLVRAGEITNLVLQPKFWLEINGKPILLKSKGFPNGRRASFKPDFRYTRVSDGAIVCEDTKSPPSRTEAYVLRRGVFEAMYPDIVFLET